MSHESINVGRPYRGTGFFCKKNKQLSFSNIPTDNERIHFIRMKNCSKNIMYFMGLYLPYNDNSNESLEIYIDTLDKAASLIMLHDDAPTVMLGDFNTVLPQMEKLPKNWFKLKPMNRRSNILYDCINNMDFTVANFNHVQEVNYTYHKGNGKSYIDHILIPRHLSNMCNHCQINTSPDNTSDHLSITCHLTIELCKGPKTNYVANFSFPKVKWNNESVKECYSLSLERELTGLTLTDPDDVNDITAAAYVNKLYDSLCASMHNATRASGATLQPPKRKNKYWWTKSCYDARKSNRLWAHIWRENDKPSTGPVWECYKSAKREYRRVCRNSLKTHLSSEYKIINNYYRTKNINRLWAEIKKKKNNKSDINVSMEELRKYYIKKFDTPEKDFSARSDVIKNNFSRSVDKNYILSEFAVRSYISKLKLHASPGIDGISGHHLKNALNTRLPLYLSSLLTICLRHSVVPEAFTRGLLIPIPKPGKDLSDPSGYRPITVSAIPSKILEYVILDSASEYKNNDLQFGYIPERGADMSIALAHDVCELSLNSGSPLFLCSLDAEGAFDAIPHEVLFSKTIDNMPLMSWKVMVTWYSHIKVNILIGSHLDVTPIYIKCGTRQGSLTSPLMFNMIYRDLIKTVNSSEHGVYINGVNYNVFNYADDLLLACTTSTGLQALINTSVQSIRAEGLDFNPKKTVCSIYGMNPLISEPKWHIDDVSLQVNDSITYLGAVLGRNASTSHAHVRIRKAQQSFYGLQPVGLHPNGIDPFSSAYLHKTVLIPTLTYGCSAVYLSKGEMHQIYSCQGKLLKANLGIHKCSKTSPLLASLGTTSTDNIIAKETVSLLRKCIYTNCATKHFYLHLLNRSNDKALSRTLVGRAYDILKDNFNNVLFNSVHCDNFKTSIMHIEHNGLTDSLNVLFHYVKSNHDIIKMLLRY